MQSLTLQLVCLSFVNQNWAKPSAHLKRGDFQLCSLNKMWHWSKTQICIMLFMWWSVTFETERKPQSHIGPCTQPQTPHLMGLSGLVCCVLWHRLLRSPDTTRTTLCCSCLKALCISDRCRGALVALDEMQASDDPRGGEQAGHVERVVCCYDERIQKWCVVNKYRTLLVLAVRSMMWNHI